MCASGAGVVRTSGDRQARYSKSADEIPSTRLFSFAARTVVSSKPRLSLASMSTLITTFVPWRALNSSTSSFMILANFSDAPTESNSADAQKCVGITAGGCGGVFSGVGPTACPVTSGSPEALLAQQTLKHDGCPWVFHSAAGNPIDVVNFTNRVWYALRWS